MEVELLFKICTRENHTRFLVKCNGEYKSIKISNNLEHEIGEVISVEQNKIEDSKEKWEKRYEKYLSSMKFIKEHFIQYAVSKNLNIGGTYNGKSYEHILQKKEDNLLLNLGYDESLKKYYNQLSNHIHKGFAHLNSSQAFAVNFFVPLIAELENGNNLFNDLLDMDLQDIKVENCEFEKELDDKTQLDFYLKAGSRDFTFEVKYSENSFGSAEKDEQHQIKYNDYYKQKLTEIISDFNYSSFEDTFYEEYQLWRNLCGLCEPNRTVCFVFPKFRVDLEEIIEEAKKKLKSEELRNRVKILKVDDYIEKQLKSTSYKYYSEFKEKYLDLN